MFVYEPTPLEKHRLLVKRPEEMPAINASVLQTCHGFGSIEWNCVIENDTKDPVDVYCVLSPLKRQLEPRMSAQTLLIPMSDLTFLHQNLFNALKLSHADRRLDITHAEVPSKLFMNVAPLLIKAKVAQRSARIRQHFIVRQNH